MKRHTIELSNHQILVIEERQEEVSICVKETSDKKIYVCAITPCGVTVYPNSGDATRHLTEDLTLEVSVAKDTILDILMKNQGQEFDVTILGKMRQKLPCNDVTFQTFPIGSWIEWTENGEKQYLKLSNDDKPIIDWQLIKQIQPNPL